MPRVLGLALTAAVAATMLLAVSAAQALASHVHCGDVLTQDTTLDSDLVDCVPGLSIGANDVTLDLNGHVLDGVASPGSTGAGVDNFANYSGLTVENGRIQQFGRGLLTGTRGGARNTLVQDVTFLDDGAAIDGPLFESRIAGNAVFGSGFPGFNLFGDNIEVEGNLLSRSGAVAPGFEPVGILLRGPGPFTVRANRVRGSYAVGIWATEAIQDILIARNSADRNAGDGIRVDTPAATVTGNHTWFNGDLGIEAVPGVTGSKNWSKHNGDRRQCVNVSCSTKGKPKK